MHLAAMMGHSDVVRVLLEAGANGGLSNAMREKPSDVATPSLASKIKSYASTGQWA
jgi:ankyrin repeat protein